MKALVEPQPLAAENAIFVVNSIPKDSGNVTRAFWTLVMLTRMDRMEIQPNQTDQDSGFLSKLQLRWLPPRAGFLVGSCKVSFSLAWPKFHP